MSTRTMRRALVSVNVLLCPVFAHLLDRFYLWTGLSDDASEVFGWFGVLILTVVHVATHILYEENPDATD